MTESVSKNCYDRKRVGLNTGENENERDRKSTSKP